MVVFLTFTTSPCLKDSPQAALKPPRLRLGGENHIVTLKSHTSLEKELHLGVEAVHGRLGEGRKTIRKGNRSAGGRARLSLGLGGLGLCCRYRRLKGSSGRGSGGLWGLDNGCVSVKTRDFKRRMHMGRGMSLEMIKTDESIGNDFLD